METLESMIELTRGAVGDSGTCSEEKAIEGINNARRLLWNKSESQNICEYLCITCVNGCITLPSRYEKVLLAWQGSYPLSISNEWYQSFNGVGKFKEGESCHRGMQEIGGKHVVFRDYTVAPYLLGLMAESSEDNGVVMTFSVRDKYSSHFNIDVKLDQSPKISLSNNLVVAVTGVSKPKTKGRVRLYAKNPTNGQSLLLAIYHPEDVNPSFRRFGIGSKNDCLTIYAKKKFREISDLGELVEFGSDAIYFALLAINSRENRKTDEYLKNLSLAVQELGKEIETYELDSSTPLNILDINRVTSLTGTRFLSEGWETKDGDYGIPHT